MLKGNPWIPVPRTTGMWQASKRNSCVSMLGKNTPLIDPDSSRNSQFIGQVLLRRVDMGQHHLPLAVSIRSSDKGAHGGAVEGGTVGIQAQRQQGADPRRFLGKLVRHTAYTGHKCLGTHGAKGYMQLSMVSHDDLRVNCMHKGIGLPPEPETGEPVASSPAAGLRGSEPWLLGQAPF